MEVGDTALELIAGAVERNTSMLETFTVRVGSRTTELVEFTMEVNTETPIVELTLTETVDDILTCGVGIKVG